MVQAHRTSSNLLQPHHFRDSKVFRVLSHEFGVVRLYRTFSIYIVTGETRYDRTFSNHIITEIYSMVCRVLSHEFGTTPNKCISTLHTLFPLQRGWLCTSSGWFKHIVPRRTSSKRITKIARCVEFCHMSSGWFDCTEPSLSTSLQGEQGVQGAYALVWGGSSTLNLVESSRTTSLQR